MGKLKLSALLLGAALYISFGATSLLASDCCKDDKCTKSEKACDKAKKACKEDCKKACCDNKKHAMKCGGEAKPASTMKCGAGKCGSN